MNERCFNESFLPLADGLYRFAFHILESESEAEDAVQDLYVRLWNARDSLDSIAAPKAYCLTLLRNMCIDRIRKAARSGTERIGDPGISSDPDELIESRETLHRVMKEMEKLPSGQRKVLEMKVLEDLSYDEISARTGMNNLTLRVLLSQARKKLKAVL